MTTRQKKAKIKRLVKDMLKESHKKAIANIDKALNAGCIDIDGWDSDNAPMVLPKTILTAILEEEARQYTARNTRYERKVKKEVENIKMFL